MAHKVRFEPVDIEIEVEEDETILNAAFRQGVTLMHGCKEGQCSACKSFLLDGDMDMERYSTFALADYEYEEGYVLLCRAHAYSDLEVELINYDEDMLRSGIPIQTARTEVEEIEELTHDIRRLSLRLVEPKEFAFSPGQYVDLTIPGTDRTRAFSMANTPETDDHLEFIIKLYPDGRFSKLLDGGLKAGDELTAKGPYGLCTLRAGSERDIVFIGGGAGMAPLLSLVRSLAEADSTRRATFYYGARQAGDLFYLDELKALEERLPEFRFVPALSEAGEGEWEGATGLITEIVEHEEGDLQGADAYLCGPPPMIDAAIPVLSTKGLEEAHLYFDRFTVSADAGEGDNP
ncbi:MAG: 2Fe-2S iron-sulfur cluster binding domain-containing protein [Actinomycetota bacterium]|nr:2Fe-2S iron-sulfur cluster binding domain-containing protein [Actinomycetota bacterium]